MYSRVWGESPLFGLLFGSSYVIEFCKIVFEIDAIVLAYSSEHYIWRLMQVDVLYCFVEGVNGLLYFFERTEVKGLLQ